MESTRKQSIGQAISAKMHAFFTDPQIETIAKEVKFVQRQSRMTGLGFVQTMVMGFLERPSASLNELAQVSQDLGMPISPQGLDERINPFSVAFLQALLPYAMGWFQQQCPLALPFLRFFRGIYILDSTFVRLPTAMQAEYPGAGGSGSSASLKIQLVFEFLSGQFAQICLQPGRNADQAYRDYLQVVRPGSLILMDLGYFCLDAFAQIIKAQAYFLSRYHYPTALFTTTGQRIDLRQFLSHKGPDPIEIAVTLGSRKQHHLACRLIAQRVTAETRARRCRKAKRKARQHYKVLTQTYLDLLGWNLFVTNVPASVLCAAQVAWLYRLRWQIELLFKLWKSYAGLQTRGLWRRDRLLTELYAKLIGCVLFQFLTAPVRIPDAQWQGRELSLFVAHKILARFAQRLTGAILNHTLLSSLIERWLNDLLRFGLKQHRKKRPNVCQLFAPSLA